MPTQPPIMKAKQSKRYPFEGSKTFPQDWLEVDCRVDMRGSCQLNLLSWRQNSLHLLCWAARRSEPGLYQLISPGDCRDVQEMGIPRSPPLHPQNRRALKNELQAPKNEMMLKDQAHADELKKAMIWRDQVKKEYKTALKFIEPSARHCLVAPSTNNDGRAGV